LEGPLQQRQRAISKNEGATRNAGDVCQRSGTDGFLVFFDQLDEADAQAKAMMIGALERLDVSPDEFLDRAGLLKAAKKITSELLTAARALGEPSAVVFGESGDAEKLDDVVFPLFPSGGGFPRSNADNT